MSGPLITLEDDLSPQEEILLSGAMRGDPVDLGGAEIRGEVLRALLNGSRPDWPVAVSGVRLSKAVVSGGLDLEGCSIAFPLLLSRVRIESGERGALVVRDARCKRISLQNCELDGAFVGDRMQADNGLLFAGGRISSALQVRGAVIGGALAVEGTRIGGGREAVKANGLRLAGPLILRRANLRGDVQLVRAQLGAGIYAENTRVEGRECGFDLESARVDGDILMSGANITAGLRLAHGRVRGRVDAAGLVVFGQETAIEAKSLSVGQGLKLVDAKLKGSMDIEGADIGKTIAAEGLEIDGGTTAIFAAGIAVGGNWDMPRSKLVGAVNLPGADIEGQLRLTEARLFGAELAIRADGARIRGGCYMSRAMVFGLLRFPACDIGNQFRLRAATLKVDAGAALMANGSRFARDVELNGGLQSIGALVLDQARVPGVLDFSNSKIKSAALARDGRGIAKAADGGALADATLPEWDEAAISLADADIKRLCMPELRDECPRGIVDLSRARAGSFHDYAAAWPPRPQSRGRSADGRDIEHLVLDGFVYDHLNNPSGAHLGGGARHSRADDRVGERRLTWLEGQQSCDIRDHFKPQPWVQLEKRLMQQGFSEDGRQISISRRRLERKSHATRPLQRLQGGFLDTFALYGFNPWRTVAWMAVFVVMFAALWAWAGGQCAKPGCGDESAFVMTNRDAYTPSRLDAVYPDFNPVGYSFDVFVPFVSFGYADHWRPNIAWKPIAEIPQPITFAPVGEKLAGGGASGGRERVAAPSIKITVGGILYVVMVLEAIVGLVLTSLLITGFTGLLRGD
ncbi:MAG: hypothetical protein K0U74_03840 [Alphaproteobacteria bacterium]|nr:hypothetical protein [Alphaproteobacteria bacterium]